MSQGSVRLPSKKCVPPGSDIHEQALDDIRQDYVQPSPTQLLQSSSALALSSPATSHHFNVTAKAELRGQGTPVGESLDHQVRPEGSLHQQRQLTDCPIPRVCLDEVFAELREWSSRGSTAKDVSSSSSRDCGGFGETPERYANENDSSVSPCVCDDEDYGPCIHTSDFATDLKAEWRNMGHSSSLQQPKRDARDQVIVESNHTHRSHHHVHHGRHRATPSSAGPMTHSHNKENGRDVAASRHHHSTDVRPSCHSNGNPGQASIQAEKAQVISRSASYGSQGPTKISLATFDELDNAGFPVDHSHPPLFRLYPPESTAERRSSPTPSSRTSEEWSEASTDRNRTRPASSPKPGDATRRQKQEEEKEGEEKGMKKLSPRAEQRQREKSPSPSPVSFGIGTFLEPRQSRSRKSGDSDDRSPSVSPIRLSPIRLSPSSSPTRLSPSNSPQLPRQCSEPGFLGSRESCSKTLSAPTPNSSPTLRAHSPTIQRTNSPNPPRQYGRLNSQGSKNLGVSNGPHADEFSLSGEFRRRTVSDISMHVRRRRQLPQPPQARSRTSEDEDHAHVHWADEARGSPLVTSVLLSSIRPRALSHGSADLPRKPILKKPYGV